MSLRKNLDFEIIPSGSSQTGSGFNSNNPNAGVNYSYGNDYQVFSYDDLAINYYNAPDLPNFSLASGLGSFTANTFYVGIRFISIDELGQIEAISQLTEDTVTVSNNDRLDIAAPLDAIHPFTHYQITLRTTASSIAYVQLFNGGAENYIAITEQFFVNSYYTAGSSISSLPSYGNIYKLSSTDRPFISDDIGNFILIENNHIGFRSANATSIDSSPAIEVCKTTNDPVAAWFDITSSTKVVRRISAVMWAEGSPSGDLFLELRTDNSGVPSNTVLGFGGINASTLTSTKTWVDINVNVSCAPGRYWIVIYLDNTPSLTDYIRVGRKSGEFGIDNQHYYTYNSGTSTWTSVNDGVAVAIDASWNSTDWWTAGNLTTLIENKANLRYEIININSGDGLIYKPDSEILSSIPSIGGLGYLGGAETSIVRAIEFINLQTYFSNLNIKDSTYIIDSPLTLSHCHLHGYSTIHDDFSDIRPLIKLDPSASPVQFQFANSGMIVVTRDHLEITSLEFDGSNVAEKIISVGDYNIYMSNCYLHSSLNNAIVIDGSSNCVSVIDNIHIGDISDANSSASGILLNNGVSLDISHSFFDNITGCGIRTIGVPLSAQFCVFNNINGATGIKGIGIRVDDASTCHIHYCTFHDMQRNALYVYGEGHAFINNNIFSTCGDYAVVISPSSPGSIGMQRIDSNAFYNNTPGNVTNDNTLGSGTRFYSVTANPFANSSTKDFRLNSAISAGYGLIGTARPQYFTETTLPQKLDVGAVQTYGNSPVPRRNPTISYI